MVQKSLRGHKDSEFCSLGNLFVYTCMGEEAAGEP